MVNNVSIPQKLLTYLGLHSPARLTALPLEILTLIIMELDWRDVLHVRQTCQRVKDACKNKLIWQNLLDLHTAQLFQKTILEKPIGLYTSAELERIFLKWKSVELAWTIDGGSPTKEKEVLVDSPISSFHILRGGRWGVLTSQFGEVSYVDLDAEEFRPIPLISPPFKNASGVVSIDENFDSPAISFNIAISSYPIPLESMPPNEDQRSKRIDVWHVEIVINNRNESTGFHAERLSTIQEDFRFRVWALSLRDSHLACLYKEANDDVYIIIFDWVLANGGSMCTSCRTLTFSAGGEDLICLLPNKRILIHHGEFISLHNYSAIPLLVHQPETPQLSDASHLWNADQLWRMPASFDDTLAFSVFKLPSGSVGVLFHTTQKIFGLSFDDSNQEARLTELLHFSPNPFYDFVRNPGSFAYRTGVLWSHRQRQLSFVQFDWPNCNDGFEPRIIPKHLSFKWQSQSQIWMNPISGRVVFIGDSLKTTLVIADFALL